MAIPYRRDGRNAESRKFSYRYIHADGYPTRSSTMIRAQGYAGRQYVHSNFQEACR